MSALLIPLCPLAAVLVSLVPVGRRLAPVATLAGAVVSLALSIVGAARVLAAGQEIAVAGWVGLDGFSALLVLVVTFLSTTAALFSVGYVAAHDYEAPRARSYYVHFNLFTFSLALVPVLLQPALAWIAIEFTAVFSVLLVAFDNTQAALEAAWKYIALMFMGAAIALLGFFMLFQVQQLTGGGHYTWEGLRAVAPRMPSRIVTGAFVFILVGFGVKVGFVPMHTWLPDAHSQAPSPVCALLSGVKTTAALYCILRLLPLLPAGPLGMSMQVIGLVSTGIAAFLLLQVRDYKRLFAYSTVEHMGIIFLAAGLGGAAGGTYAALLQIVSHSLTKSFCFLTAGAVLLTVGTREIAAVRGLVRRTPATGVALLFGALAIGGAPPFAVFLSEFAVFRAGLAQGHYVTTGLLAAFIAVAFFGILRHVKRMVFGVPSAVPATEHAPRAPLAPPARAALVLAAAPVLVLGMYQPHWLHSLVTLAASSLAPTLP